MTIKSEATVSTMKKVPLKDPNRGSQSSHWNNKLVSIDFSYSEIGWDTLETRRKRQNLFLFYKMVNHLTPLYQLSFIPPTVNETPRYSLRTANNITTINAQ